MSEQATITWTRPMLERFKRKYQRAVDAKIKYFTFDGNDFVVDYAKYLIQYLDDKL